MFSQHFSVDVTSDATNTVHVWSRQYHAVSRPTRSRLTVPSLVSSSTNCKCLMNEASLQILLTITFKANSMPLIRGLWAHFPPTECCNFSTLLFSLEMIRKRPGEPDALSDVASRNFTHLTSITLCTLCLLFPSILGYIKSSVCCFPPFIHLSLARGSKWQHPSGKLLCISYTYLPKTYPLMFNRSCFNDLAAQFLQTQIYRYNHITDIKLQRIILFFSSCISISFSIKHN